MAHAKLADPQCTISRSAALLGERWTLLLLRQVFLGTLVLGDEQRAIPYGADTDRDLAGFIERMGPRKYRLILPYPRFESLIDVVELVPAT